MTIIFIYKCQFFHFIFVSFYSFICWHLFKSIPRLVLPNAINVVCLISCAMLQSKTPPGMNVKAPITKYTIRRVRSVFSAAASATPRNRNTVPTIKRTRAVAIVFQCCLNLACLEIIHNVTWIASVFQCPILQNYKQAVLVLPQIVQLFFFLLPVSAEYVPSGCPQCLKSWNWFGSFPSPVSQSILKELNYQM